jgi:hypothetical protein
VIPVALRVVRSVCLSLFLAGIPALIVSSIAGNNEGWVLTFGMITAVAAVVLMAVSASSSDRRLDAFDEVAAERLEARIVALVAAGADEDEVRALGRDSLDLARGRG